MLYCMGSCITAVQQVINLCTDCKLATQPRLKQLSRIYFTVYLILLSVINSCLILVTSCNMIPTCPEPNADSVIIMYTCTGTTHHRIAAIHATFIYKVAC